MVVLVVTFYMTDTESSVSWFNTFYCLTIVSLLITIFTLFYSLQKIWQIQKSLKAVKLKTVYTSMHFFCVILLLLQWLADFICYNLSKHSKDVHSCEDESKLY